MKKPNPRYLNVLSIAIMYAGLLIALVGVFLFSGQIEKYLFFAGMGMVLAGIIVHLQVKCPFCGFSLAGLSPFPRRCPKCRKRLTELKKTIRK